VYTRVPASNAVFLTFDDGPDPNHTPRILELLERHGVRATFFLQGDRVESHGNIVRDVVAGGHTLGNHSYSHPSFAKITLQRQAEEIDRTNGLLSSFDGWKRHVFRPPYGHLSAATLALCALRWQRVALWTHDSFDYRLDADAIVERFATLSVRAGDILLFHDDGAAGVAALDRLLPRWRGAGLEFAAI
jgi:peptidoglycan/xylan/chitin deacetylase (PgdA/CDA1 family)